MTVHFKIAGEWTQITRPYVKINDVWTPVKEVWVKRSGVWTKSFEYDITPPPPPLLSVELIETKYTEQVSGKTVTKYGRHLKIGTRSSTGHDPDIKRIRILSTYANAAPTTQFGGTYTSTPDKTYPNEPWSDWHFNGYGGSSLSKETNLWRYKTWPRSATTASQLAAGTHYFTAWTEDHEGNWSVGNGISFTVPKNVTDEVINIRKDARFQAQYAGTIAATGYSAGQLFQRSSPYGYGVWMYNDSIRVLVGQQGAADVRTAQIYVQRAVDDGAATSNVYLWWHDYANPGALPAPGSVVRRNITKLGTIGKGESKWFTLPATHVAAIEARSLRGFGLYYKDPAKATVMADDYTVIKSIDETVRTGEVRLIWVEKP